MSISNKFTNICDICGKSRNKGSHLICSKKRQELGKIGLIDKKKVKRRIKSLYTEDSMRYFKKL